MHKLDFVSKEAAFIDLIWSSFERSFEKPNLHNS